MLLAEKGRGFVSPNPVVGALIVRKGRIIAKNWHRKFGEGHAERNILESFDPSVPKLKAGTSSLSQGKNLGNILEGDVLYVNLEPCCHQGKTPACTDIILESGIKKVVVGLFDPNPEVAGKGVKLLRSKGVEVLVLEEEMKKQGNKGIKKLETRCQTFVDQLKWQNRFFFRWVIDRRPWTMMKIAQTLDGRIVPDRGQQMWLTGEESGQHVHQVRAQYDAILVGAKTVIVDNPQLSVRLSKGEGSLRPACWTGRQVRDAKVTHPRVVVLDAALSIPLKSKVVRKGTILFKGRQYKKRHTKKKALERAGVDVVDVDMNADAYLAIHQVLAELAARGVSSVIIEGGPSVWSSFCNAGLVDEVMIYIAPKFLGKGVESLEFRDDSSDKMNLELKEMKVLGDDVYLNLKKKISGE